MHHQKAKITVVESRARGKNNNQQAVQGGDRIEIVYYTDPLCCWSWAMEPQWRRLQYEYRDIMSTRYCMGGLISDWNNFNDSVNSISRPIQMGPVWAEARHMSGMPVCDRIWMSDPPATSYTACVAVKCAGLQSKNAEERFLRKCREELMINGINVAKQSSLIYIAEQLAAELDDFSADNFKEDFISGAGTEAFKNDLKEVRYKKIGRFPSLLLCSPGRQSIMISGYRPYEVLRQAIDEIAGKAMIPAPIKEEDFIAFFATITEREIKEAVK